jgi:hypothetical protein
MRYSIFFFGILFLLSSDLAAQSAPEPVHERVRRILIDSGQIPVQGRDRNVTLDKGTKVGLEHLLGLSKQHAMAVISHYDYQPLPKHESYPFIKDVIEIKNFRRWDAPVTLYVFIDSENYVCRLNYILGDIKGISPEEAHAVFERLTKSHGSLNYVPDVDWEIAGWQEKDRSYLYAWQKGIPMVQPSYLLSLKSYLDNHLLPYMKGHDLPNDGTFTPVPKMQIGEEIRKY